MFIALRVRRCALQRSAMCFAGSLHMPLLTERGKSGHQGYKHVAPPEQRLDIRTEFLAKLLCRLSKNHGPSFISFKNANKNTFA